MRSAGSFLQQLQRLLFGNLLAMRADDRRLRAIRPDASIDLHGEPFIDGIHQPADMMFDVRRFDELAAEVAGIDDFEEIIEQFE